MDGSSNASWVEGRVGLVTGATSGIGHALAVCLSERGARVVLHGRTQDRIVATVPGSHESNYVVGDLGTPEGCEAVEAAILRISPDMLILNAGEVGDKALVSDLRDDEIVRMISVNLISQIRLARAFTRLPKKHAFFRRLVLVLSTSCFYARPEMSLYVAAKSGLMGFGRALQQEAGELSVRTMLIYPGRTNTHIREGHHPEYTSPRSAALIIAALLSVPDDLVCYEFSFRPPVDTRI
jgi:NAD(P)-dependent dehydrogenase (short-subunit alcohol dehydrogenase family)